MTLEEKAFAPTDAKSFFAFRAPETLKTLERKEL